ncbi:hypothetical protein AOLI_G00263430 [Acnodon oligacanthus]
MWHQRSSNGQQSPQKRPETEQCDPFLSFVTRSRAVHRHRESSSGPPALSRYDDAFWHKVLQSPSEESFSCDPLNELFTAPAELVCGHTGSSCLEKLPSPATLMRKKRKKRGGDEERHTPAVKQHIRELRKKQSIIDELMGEKRWGSSVSWRSEGLCERAEGEQDIIPQDDHHHSLLTDSPVSRENVFSGYQQLLDLAPGGNPMTSFAGTAHREVLGNWEQPGVSHAEFWGFGYNIEE